MSLEDNEGLRWRRRSCARPDLHGNSGEAEASCVERGLNERKELQRSLFKVGIQIFVQTLI